MILKRPLYLVSNFSFCNSKNIVLFIHLFNCPYDESTVSLPDDVDSSDEELSDPSNLDYLERPISHYYDEDELFGCKLPKPQRSNGILKKGGVHLHKQVHLRSLNCLDDSVEFATPPSAPPIIDADFPPQLERFSKGSPMNEQNDSWPSRESVAGRSECSIEQKPSNVKATTDFAQRLDRTITEDTERPHLAYYNTSSCNSQYAWQTLITYDACIRLCLQAWARGCTEAPEFLKDECLALQSAFGLHDFLLQPRGVKVKPTEGINARNSEQTFPLKMKKVVGKIRVEVRKLRIIPRRKLQILVHREVQSTYKLGGNTSDMFHHS